MNDKLTYGERTMKKSNATKPIYLQTLEAALDIRPYMSFMEKVLAESSSSESDSESDISEKDEARGKKLVNGLVTDKEDRRSDKMRLYNIEGINPDDERNWLKNVILSDTDSTYSSDDEDDDDDDKEEISEAYLVRMLREHIKRKKYAAKYYRNPNNSRYMYYGTGLLSSIDRWPAIQRGLSHSSVPFNSRNANRRMPAKSSNSRSRTKKPPPNPDSDRDEWEDVYVKREPEEEAYAKMNPRAAARARKKAAMSKRPEVLTARRRKLWQLMCKKELPKVQRTRTATHKDTLQNCKRMATLCMKYHRQKAMQSQKNMKETIWRCKRLTREMLSYWKRYDKVERETRRRMEKEAEEQRKMDIEMIEAKRQQRKLNFLITQTELYAHFMSHKISQDGQLTSETKILSNLDEDFDNRISLLDPYDVEAMKEIATKNATDAFIADQMKAKQFDSLRGCADSSENVSAGIGEYAQPSLFQGTLKGYQLKGMNWLSNLYDQGISGILADEMGLGKTVQCIAFLCHVAERLGIWGPFLVISPASTLHNWQQEMERFAPHFKVVPYWGSPNERKILRQFWERKDLHTRDAAFHVVITSYQIVVGDVKYLNRIKWQYMILDEAQAIKSSGSQRWKLLLGFSCRNRLLLSGTPIQNSMAELWALLHFIMPTLFDSHDEFNEWFSKDIESHAENKSTIDEKHLSRLHMILKPFMLRRIKKDVENELSDKIEIMVYCPLTRRQNLLYYALKKKIQIDDLLHYSVGSETGHSDKNFTSNLMNLVMQFRKVCNHPELFERRDVKSPLFVKSADYTIPKLITDELILIDSMPSKRHWLFNKLSILTTEFIHRNLFNENCVGGFFSFLRFINMSPRDLYNFFLGDWFNVIAFMLVYNVFMDRIRHRNIWWSGEICDNENVSNTSEKSRYCDSVLSKHKLLICSENSAFNALNASICDDLVFNKCILNSDKPIYSYNTHSIISIPETIEHRIIRSKNIGSNLSLLDQNNAISKKLIHKGKELISPVSLVEEICDKTCLVDEFVHKPRPVEQRLCQPTSLPKFLFSSTVKVLYNPIKLYSCSRAAAHSWSHRELMLKKTASLAPLPELPSTTSLFSIPDKQSLVTDAGKLNVLDGLLTKLKSQGHRVLIYSQMTKMIDLLEEYMWHRKHKYMRLDGSSKISARRDMVADFQARSDIFVFLLSTRAGGLGINLTAADTVIFYDSDWNPTVDQQAMDRAHRLGQTKQVTVYRLICKGTIEERIMQRAREKSEIQRMVISGGNFKPDTLKPKEVVSLLLDDEEIEQKYRLRAEERRSQEELRLDQKLDKERKRKICGFTPKTVDLKKGKFSGEESCSTSPSQSVVMQDENSSEGLIIDIESPSTSSMSFHSPTPSKIVTLKSRSKSTPSRSRPRPVQRSPATTPKRTPQRSRKPKISIQKLL